MNRKLSNIFIIVLLIIGILCAILLSGCNEVPTISQQGSIPNPNGLSDYSVYETNYKGHIYVYTKVHGGISMAHAGHCKCNKNE